jgi:glycosyltransferase involved in cell wall biosynthesis
MNVESPAGLPEVSIVVPARNEEACLGDCLASLTAQTGVALEIIVVDDHSTDRTGEIARGFAGVRVISAGPLPQRWTGKNNAVAAGAREARGEWLLFTDADTVHLPGSLARALAEAKEERADLLSYSPEQIVVTFAEKAVMPVIFAELAAQYPPAKVRDSSSGVVAANGQYILVRRAAYDAVEGHAAIAGKILEDVALARAFRAAAYKVFFRNGPDAVRTRMYRSWPELREGWTKNLALLFPRPRWLAAWIVAWWASSWITLLVGLASIAAGYWRLAYYLLPAVFLYLRIARAHFRMGTNLIAVGFGAPLFGYLLLRSKRAHASGSVSWKGRTYSGMCGVDTLVRAGCGFDADTRTTVSAPHSRTTGY